MWLYLAHGNNVFVSAREVQLGGCVEGRVCLRVHAVEIWGVCACVWVDPSWAHVGVYERGRAGRHHIPHCHEGCLKLQDG